MLQEINDPKAIYRAILQAKRVAEGTNDFVDGWISPETIVVAEESALHFDEEMCQRFAAAFRRAGIEHLLAVETEHFPAGSIVYYLEPTAQDLAEFSFECGSFSYLLLGADRIDLAILCSYDDFLLIGGHRSFVVDAVGDLGEAKKSFEEFISSHLEIARPPLERAYTYFATLE